MPSSVLSFQGSVRSLGGTVVGNANGEGCCCGGGPGPTCVCETFPHPVCHPGQFGPGGAHILASGSYHLTPQGNPTIAVSQNVPGTCCYGPNARVREYIEQWYFCDTPPSGFGNCPGSLYNHLLRRSTNVPMFGPGVGSERYIQTSGCCTPIVVNETRTYNAPDGRTVFGRAAENFRIYVQPGISDFWLEFSGGFYGSCTVIVAQAVGRFKSNSFGWMRFQNRYLAFVDPDNAECYPQECHRACCLPGGVCLDHLNSAQCTALGGIPQAPYSTCYSAQCNVPGTDKGACCNPTTGGCIVTRPQDCVPPNTFKGLGTLCDGGPSEFQCPQPTGKCCVPSGGGGYNCQGGLTPAQCNALNGLWGGAGSLCGPGACPSAGNGACCTWDGLQWSCQLVPFSQCAAIGGWWTGSPDCQAVDCNQFNGACCTQVSHGWTCSVTPQASCTAGSVWHGAGTQCTPGMCEGTTGAPRLGVEAFTRPFLVLPDGTPAASVGSVRGCAGCGGAKGEKL